MCTTKKLRAMFYSENILRASSLGVSISSNLEKTAPRKWGGEPGYIGVLQQRTGSRNKSTVNKRKLDNSLKSRGITLSTKVHIVKAIWVSGNYVWTWELGHKESWAPKNWCFCTVVLEKTLGSPLNCKEIKPVNPKGNKSWIFIGKTDAETEAPILWQPGAKSQLIGKDPGVGKNRRQRSWRTGKPGIMQSMGTQRVGHNWVTKQQGDISS